MVEGKGLINDLTTAQEATQVEVASSLHTSPNGEVESASSPLTSPNVEATSISQLSEVEAASSPHNPRDSHPSQNGEVEATSISQLSQNGEVEAASSLNTSPDGEVQAASSPHIPADGEVEATSISQPSQNGEVEATSISQPSQNGEVEAASSSLNTSPDGEVEATSLSHPSQNGEVEATSLSHPSQNAEVEAASFAHIPPDGEEEATSISQPSQNGEMEAASISQPTQHAEVEPASSLNTSPDGEVEAASSPHTCPDGEVEAASTPHTSPEGEVEAASISQPSQNGELEAASTPLTSPKGEEEVSLTPDPAPDGMVEASSRPAMPTARTTFRPNAADDVPLRPAADSSPRRAYGVSDEAAPPRLVSRGAHALTARGRPFTAPHVRQAFNPCQVGVAAEGGRTWQATHALSQGGKMRCRDANHKLEIPMMLPAVEVRVSNLKMGGGAYLPSPRPPRVASAPSGRPAAPSGRPPITDLTNLLLHLHPPPRASPRLAVASQLAAARPRIADSLHSPRLRAQPSGEEWQLVPTLPRGKGARRVAVGWTPPRRGDASSAAAASARALAAPAGVLEMVRPALPQHPRPWTGRQRK
ncbi:hypothetical protein AB1Y20_014661 [Prymnesium parvum]|uniref:Uncharacterized protein n=1 Tax=Prymnesium parvum TaxID=97485 RepID=A0AB34IDY8_PRYPA